MDSLGLIVIVVVVVWGVGCIGGVGDAGYESGGAECGDDGGCNSGGVDE